MKIFLDSSVAVAASLSATGASREVFNQAAGQGWRLLISPWVLREVRDNLANQPPESARTWVSLRGKLTVEPMRRRSAASDCAAGRFGGPRKIDSGNFRSPSCAP